MIVALESIQGIEDLNTGGDILLTSIKGEVSNELLTFLLHTLSRTVQRIIYNQEQQHGKTTKPSVLYTRSLSGTEVTEV